MAVNELPKAPARMELDPFEAVRALDDLTVELDQAQTDVDVFDAGWIAVRRLMDCETFNIAAFDEQRELLLAVYGRHFTHKIPVEAFPPLPLSPPGSGTMSQVVRTGKPVLFEDFRAAFQTSVVRYAGIAGKNLHEVGPAPADEDEEIPPSAVMVPLRFEGSATGVLSVMATNEGAFDEAHLEFVGRVADAMGSALDYVRRRAHA